VSYVSKFAKPVGCHLFANKLKMNYYFQEHELYIVITVVRDILLVTIIASISMMLLAFSSSSFYFLNGLKIALVIH
jgi:hypothetical protein